MINVKPGEANSIIVRRHRWDELPGAERHVLLADGLIHYDQRDWLPEQGEVVAVGPGRRLPNGRILPPPPVKPGDTVVFSHHGVVPFEVDGVELLLVDHAQVLATIED